MWGDLWSSMGAPARYDEAAISENSGVVVASLTDRLSEVSQVIQRRLATVIPELWDDSGVVELLAASVKNNVDTVFHAVRYEIPMEKIEPPTAALEYARRMAQRAPSRPSPPRPTICRRRSSPSVRCRRWSPTSICRSTIAGCTSRAGPQVNSSSTTSATHSTRERRHRFASEGSCDASRTRRLRACRSAAARRWWRSAVTADGSTSPKRQSLPPRSGFIPAAVCRRTGGICLHGGRRRSHDVVLGALDDRVELGALALGHAELREGLVEVVHERIPLRAGDAQPPVRVEHRAP